MEVEMLRNPTNTPPLLLQRLNVGKLLLAQIIRPNNVPVRKDG
jgi:hypothetical protein